MMHELGVIYGFLQNKELYGAISERLVAKYATLGSNCTLYFVRFV